MAVEEERRTSRVLSNENIVVRLKSDVATKYLINKGDIITFKLPPRHRKYGLTRTIVEDIIHIGNRNKICSQVTTFPGDIAL
ncbi:Hypothetical predicted protein [Octopus vulgaris]|uniref:Uncharacterized protein n=1 Tax=Octopus vulgaris TaxID=6645 RepID=A0AA36BEX2_OCTVU|nr:Hypothetical predicted protein [Octopus vulgaris]